MAYYLITGRYTPESLKGMAENCEDRTEALQKGLAAFGGGMDRMFMALGGLEFVLIAELMDNMAAMAFGSVVVRSGTVVDFKVTPLITMTKMPDVFRMANQSTGEYRPAGVSKIVP
jgi:uncharacterized protein with GYD domain